MDLDQDPEHLTELLRESLKNLEGAREREAAIREEAQWLYAGLTELADSTSSMDVLIRLNELLASKAAAQPSPYWQAKCGQHVPYRSVC